MAVKLGVERPIPVPNELSKPFWEACNERRLVVQNCTACNRLQHPPDRQCGQCRSGDNLEWKQVSGRGRIFTFGITSDTRYVAFYPIQPYTSAVITLEEDDGIMFFSNLPGTPINSVTTHAPVQVEFEEVKGGQLIPEWSIVR